MRHELWANYIARISGPSVNFLSFFFVVQRMWGQSQIGVQFIFDQDAKK